MTVNYLLYHFKSFLSWWRYVNLWKFSLTRIELCPTSFSKLKLFQKLDLNLTPPHICSQHFVGPPRDNEMKFIPLKTGITFKSCCNFFFGSVVGSNLCKLCINVCCEFVCVLFYVRAHVKNCLSLLFLLPTRYNFIFLQLEHSYESHYAYRGGTLKLY